MTESSLVVRTVALADAAVICRYRGLMLEEAGYEVSDEALGRFRAWLEPRLQSGAYFGYIVEDSDKPVAAVGMMVLDWPPHPLHPHSSARGYVLNVFVEPAYRRRGIARNLMQRAEVEFTRRGIFYCVLHASPHGRPLYENTGWTQTNEMRKMLVET